MTAAQTEQYLRYALELELSVYASKKALNKIHDNMSKLGKKKYFKEPELKKADVSFSGVAFFTAIVGGIVGLIYSIVQIVNDLKEGLSLSTLIGDPITAIVVTALGALIGGVVGGAIFWFILNIVKKHNMQREYEENCNKYREDMRNDAKRVEKEERKKRTYKKQYDELYSTYYATCDALNELYGYGVLHSNYRNIYAVGTMLSYFESGRTRSLQFDASTGDQGAYNIYENEKRLDKIITNTEEILRKLDSIADNQREIAIGLSKANRLASELNSNVRHFAAQTAEALNDIRVCEEITAYNTRQAARELEIMRWMRSV